MDNNTPTGEKDTELFFSSVRERAIRVLNRFERSDAYLEKLLQRELANADFNPMDRALFTELVNGVIRWRWKLDWVLSGFYHGDYLKCLNIVKNALRLALYQILFLDRVPDHASINESVELVKKIQGQKTASLVNGVLRNIARNVKNIRYPDPNTDPIYFMSVMESHPRWLVRKWSERYGEKDTDILLKANNRKPYVPVRINTLKYSESEFIEVLKKLNIDFAKFDLIDNSLILKNPGRNIADLQEFKDGRITIQDPSASMAVKLAAPQKEWNVIDMCAAPGGKSILLAELMEDTGTIVAIDKYESKLGFINEAKDRMGFSSITTYVEDATTLSIDSKADLIFIDAPCSGLGTLSKKPDIKWKRERDDIAILADIQKEILNNAARLVSEDGVIVFSTCTIEPEENTEIAEWFLKTHPEFELDRAENYLPKEVCKDGYMQIFQHIHFIDGSFAARFIRKSG